MMLLLSAQKFILARIIELLRRPLSLTCLRLSFAVLTMCLLGRFAG
jgi:hypothetical protein